MRYGSCPEKSDLIFPQSPDNTHSKAYSALLINWLAPGGVYQGARRIYVVPQADDLFLGSFVWDIASHSNPLTKSYRITAQDLQSLAEYVYPPQLL